MHQYNQYPVLLHQTVKPGAKCKNKVGSPGVAYLASGYCVFASALEWSSVGATQLLHMAVF